jgi:polar amino acid transport system substrate-binding protein
MKRRAVLVCTLALGLPALAAQGEDAITLLYSERPPYMDDSGPMPPQGLTATPTAHAFKNAGVPAVWSKIPTNRQLAMVREGQGKACAVGWFWTEERSHYAKFTKPIYRDKDWYILTNADFAARGYKSLDEMLSHKETRVLVKDQYTYGDQLDKLLHRHSPTIASSTGSTAKMLQSISMGAVDLMFVSEDEGAYLMAHAGEHGPRLRLLHPHDMPRGPERYLMCTREVPDDVIARLNKAITFK